MLGRYFRFSLYQVEEAVTSDSQGAVATHPVHGNRIGYGFATRLYLFAGALIGAGAPNGCDKFRPRLCNLSALVVKELEVRRNELRQGIGIAVIKDCPVERRFSLQYFRAKFNRAFLRG